MRCSPYIYTTYSLTVFTTVDSHQSGGHIVLYTPIFKCDDKTSVSNYHPISLLCVTSKVLEWIIYEIIHFICEQISTHQFGFMGGRSTQQQLLIFINFHWWYPRKHQSTKCCHFAKTFDWVPHNELLLKLWKIGITRHLWLWFNCYLSNRRQCPSQWLAFYLLCPGKHLMPFIISGLHQWSVLSFLMPFHLQMIQNAINVSLNYLISSRYSKTLIHYQVGQITGTFSST